MSIQGRITITVYCNGGFHAPFEVVIPFPSTRAAAQARVRAAGWTVTKDGSTFCPQHKPAPLRRS